ncbi:MAG: eukaryotic-like serine/threonine-protein kinase [Solirubrobacteraceae bacterium]|nr:eukaryotic-like serine/threonine-protein kinase [Solirubrobacteraceae bacterium]
MASTEPIRISPGDIIDDFEIVEPIATGGSSTTFRAMHRTLAREVSLKYVHPAAFDGGGAMEDARADATRVARLEHPGIAPVFAAGLHEGGLYIASAMPKGRTLAELGADRAITPAVTARVLTDVAEALEVAHAQGVVHRDLRPECVTVDRWGHGVVRDFGVTRTSGRTGLLTRAEVLESLRYTAPELVLGRPATPASDVYELAAVAVWCLTGAPPYTDRPAAEYVVFRASAAPPELAQRDGTPATAINTLLTAAMAVDPAQRPAPAEFAFALTAAVDRLAPAVRDAGCPLTASEATPAPPPLPAQTAAANAIAGDSTRIEQRRPLPAAAGAAVAPTPWSTYAACAMGAVVLGLGGLLVGSATAPEPPAPIRIGAFELAAGDTWTRAVGTGDSKLTGASLAGSAGETAAVGVVTDKRLPGDPVPAELLPDARTKPRAARSGAAALVTYTGAGDTVVARPTSRGTIVARCSHAIALGRCAALVVHAQGPGRGLAVSPATPVSDGLREGMTTVEQATGIASAEMQGAASQQAGAAGRLATALREAATGLELAGVDPGTGAQLEQLRNALGGEAGALEALGSALDRRSDVAFDAATEQVRASRRKIDAALAAFRRAGYPVKR